MLTWHASTAGGRRCPAGDVARELGLSQQTTSHHLGVLRDAGLATGVRHGTRRLYAVRSDGVVAVRAFLDDCWPSRPAAHERSTP